MLLGSPLFNPICSTLPIRFTLAFVAQTNINGDIRSSPFDFRYIFSELIEGVVTTTFIQNITVTRDGQVFLASFILYNTLILTYYALFQNVDGWKVRMGRYNATSAYARQTYYLGQTMSTPSGITLEDFETSMFHVTFNNRHLIHKTSQQAILIFRERSGFISNISQKSFLNHFFVNLLPNSTSAPDVFGFIPSVLEGSLRAEVTFSEPLPFNVTMILFSEFSTLCTINNAQKISQSFIAKKSV